MNHKIHFLKVMTTILTIMVSPTNNNVWAIGTGPFGFLKSQYFEFIGGYEEQASFTTGLTFPTGAGTSYSSYSNNQRIAINSVAAKFYVADANASRVSMYSLSTGTLLGSIGKLDTGVPNTGSCLSTGGTSGWCIGGTFTTAGDDTGFTSPTSIAIDTTGNRLYIGESFKISVYNLSTGVFIGAVGKTSASSGTCPVGNNTSTGWCTGGTYASDTKDGGFSTIVKALALDKANDRLYYADGLNRVGVLTASTGVFIGHIGVTSATTGTCPSSGAASGWCTGGTFAASTVDGGFSTPVGLVVNSTGNKLYVVSGNHRISTFTASSGAFVGSIGKTSATSGTCPASGAASGWCTGGTFATGADDGMLSSPTDIALDVTNDKLYIVDGGNARVVYVTASTGAFGGAIGKTTATTGTCPASAVTSGWCTGGTFGSYTSDGGFSGGIMTGLAVDVSSDTLLVGSSYRIDKFTASTGVFVGASNPTSTSPTTWMVSAQPVSGTGNGMFATTVSGIAVNSATNRLFASDETGHRINLYNATSGAYLGSIGKTTASSGTCASSGAVTGWCTGGTFGSGAGDGMFNTPLGLAVDSTNNKLYIADSGNHRIVVVNASTGGFIGAWGKVTASAGTCPASGATGSWCTGGTFGSGNSDGMLNSPNGLALDVTGDILYIADTSNFRVVKLTASTGVFGGTIGRSSSSTGTCPNGGVATGWCTGGVPQSGAADGMYSNVRGLFLDKTNDNLYLGINSRISKVTASSGAFVGSIGKLGASTGTCPSSGNSTGWCTGGTFTTGLSDGELNILMKGVTADVTGNRLFVATPTSNLNKVMMFNLTTGAYIGAMGVPATSTGTCIANRVNHRWCTGGIYATVTVKPQNIVAPSSMFYDTSSKRLLVGTQYKLMKINPRPY